MDQFGTEKCLNAASTENLVFYDNKFDPRAIQIVQIPRPGLKVGAKPRVHPGRRILVLFHIHFVQGFPMSTSRFSRTVKRNLQGISSIFLNIFIFLFAWDFYMSGNSCFNFSGFPGEWEP